MSDKAVILCVDDEPSILRSLGSHLRLEGYEVLTALSAEEGLGILAEHPVDVIIADQRMPGMTGSEFLRKVREKYLNIISIMLSGYSDFPGLISAINEGGIFRFFPKPWEQEQLNKAIKEALEHKKLITLMAKVVQNFGTKMLSSGDFSVDVNAEGTLIKVSVKNKGKILDDAVLRIFEYILAELGIANERRQNIISLFLSEQGGKIDLNLAFDTGMNADLTLVNLPKKTEE